MKKKKRANRTGKAGPGIAEYPICKKGYDLYWDHCFDGDRWFCAKQQGKGFG